MPADDAFPDAVPLAPDGRIDADIPCCTCGYNLRTLQPNATCPECACAIPRSVSEWLQARPRGLTSARIGAVLLTTAALGSAALLVVRIYYVYLSLGLIRTFVVPLGWSVGAFLLVAPVRRSSDPEAPRAWALATRVAACISLPVLCVWQHGLPVLVLQGASPARLAMAFALGAIPHLAVAGACICGRWLAKLIRQPRLATWAMAVLCLVVGSGVMLEALRAVAMSMRSPSRPLATTGTTITITVTSSVPPPLLTVLGWAVQSMRFLTMLALCAWLIALWRAVGRFARLVRRPAGVRA